MKEPTCPAAYAKLFRCPEDFKNSVNWGKTTKKTYEAAFYLDATLYLRCNGCVGPEFIRDNLQDTTNHGKIAVKSFTRGRA